MSTIIDTLIYDRTYEDVERVRQFTTRILKYGFSDLTSAEQAEYMAGMKGAYNYTDMNRIGQAIAYIANRMTSIPTELAYYRNLKGVAYDPVFDVPYDPDDVVVNPKTNWAMGDVPLQSQATSLLNDLSILQEQIVLPAGTPGVPTTLDGLDHIAANEIEYLLYVIDTTLSETEDNLYSMIDRACAAFLYAGVAYSGE